MKIPKQGFAVKEMTVEEGRLALRVEVDRDVVDNAFKKIHRVLAKELRVPGFRQGKAPMSVLARYVGQEKFDAEVERELLPAYYYAAVRAERLRPIGDVEYDEKELAYQRAFSFVARVPVAPAADLGDYNGIALKAPDTPEPDESQVEAEVQRLRRRAAKLQSKEEGAVAVGDMVFAQIEGTIDGREYKTLSAQNRALMIGENEFAPGFDEQLVGAALNEERAFSLTLPGDFGNDFLAGKKADFKVKVTALQEVQMPAVDDEFARDVGDFKTLDELKERIRKDLGERKKSEARDKFSKELQDRLVALVSVELPESYIEEKVVEELEERKRRVAQGGLSFEDYCAEFGKTEKGLRIEVREQVERELKLQSALDAVAEREGISVSEDEVRQRIELTARLLRMPPREVEARLDILGSRITKFDELAREKALALLKERFGLPKKVE